MIFVILAILVGSLFATGTYLVLRRGEIKLILGLALLSHGVNLLLFGTGSLRRGQPPVLDKANPQVLTTFSDPLPQALILTAIVISFGITAFLLVLVHRRNAVHLSQPTSAGTAGQDEYEPTPEFYLHGLDQSDDDYVWLTYGAAAPSRGVHRPGHQGQDQRTGTP